MNKATHKNVESVRSILKNRVSAEEAIDGGNGMALYVDGAIVDVSDAPMAGKSEVLVSLGNGKSTFGIFDGSGIEVRSDGKFRTLCDFLSAAFGSDTLTGGRYGWSIKA